MSQTLKFSWNSNSWLPLKRRKNCAFAYFIQQICAIEARDQWNEIAGICWVLRMRNDRRQWPTSAVAAPRLVLCSLARNRLARKNAPPGRSDVLESQPSTCYLDFCTYGVFYCNVLHANAYICWRSQRYAQNSIKEQGFELTFKICHVCSVYKCKRFSSFGCLILAFSSQFY